MKQQTKSKRVALLVETSNAYARGILRGIRNYVESRGNWSLYLGEHRRGETVPSWLRNWDGDGVIARIENQQIAKQLIASKLPTVDVSAARHLPEIPYVETDDVEFATTAAEHLLGRGFTNLAFSGDRRFMWSNNRRVGFQNRVEAAGRSIDLHETAENPGNFETERNRLIKWLTKLPKPVGIMACYDIRGREILNACREASIAVPFEVAVVGVDDDDLICEMSHPPLSSVVPDSHRTGYEAASLLERMMAGEEVPPGAHLIPSKGIAARQSTDILAVDDKEVAAALRFIQNHALDGIQVDDILQQVVVSRRVLEQRFRQSIGRTPHQEIVRVQIDRVKRLLSNTDLTLESIAQRCGFRHSEYMSVVFKRITGTSPGKFRAGKF
jgi:LacI family transcriptional regulator